MRRVCLGAEHQFDTTERYKPGMRTFERTDQAVAMAAMFLSAQVEPRAIVALTESGATAQWLSRYRSAVPIYALSRRAAARRRMMLLRDVVPVEFDPHGVDAAHAAKAAIQHLYNQSRLAEGDRVILTHGDHTGQHGGTNTLKLLGVGAGGVAEGLGDL
jgi:pyruvate kinase